MQVHYPSANSTLDFKSLKSKQFVNVLKSCTQFGRVTDPSVTMTVVMHGTMLFYMFIRGWWLLYEITGQDVMCGCHEPNKIFMFKHYNFNKHTPLNYFQ